MGRGCDTAMHSGQADPRAGPQGGLSRATAPPTDTLSTRTPGPHTHELLEGRTVLMGHIQAPGIEQVLNKSTATEWLPGNICLLKDSSRKWFRGFSGSKQILQPLSLLLAGSPSGVRPHLSRGGSQGARGCPPKECHSPWNAVASAKT